MHLAFTYEGAKPCARQHPRLLVVCSDRCLSQHRDAPRGRCLPRQLRALMLARPFALDFLLVLPPQLFCALGLSSPHGAQGTGEGVREDGLVCHHLRIPVTSSGPPGIVAGITMIPALQVQI